MQQATPRVADRALQIQPFMFGSGFASQVLAPAGDGQPAWVSAGVHWAAGLVGGSPALWNSLFAAIQLALGIGMLVRPLVRIAELHHERLERLEEQ